MYNNDYDITHSIGPRIAENSHQTVSLTHETTIPTCHQHKITGSLQHNIQCGHSSCYKLYT